MFCKRFNKIKIKNKRIAWCVIFIFLILILLSFLTVVNIITVIKLERETKTAVEKITIINDANKDTTKTQDTYLTNDYYQASSTNKYIYSNATSELFFSSYYINTEKTNMFFDDLATALTFKPVYSLEDVSCQTIDCQIEDEKTFVFNDEKIIYQNQEIKLPEDLVGRKINNFNYSKLSNKWILSFTVDYDHQEAAYVYLWDGQKLEEIIAPEIKNRIITRYNRGGGIVSAGGDDNQFLVLYSGYEIIGYYYNNGKWQDVSSFFNLRLSSGGFKAKIIRGGEGNLANWYICSDDTSKAKFIKLWQNKTNSIQGLIDLSSFLKYGPVMCKYGGDRELNIINNSDSAYVFKDKGFDNSHSYNYLSNNFSSYRNKNVLSANLYSYVINALDNSYDLSISNDYDNWQLYQGKSISFQNTQSDILLVKAEFKPAFNEYSPWFNGLDLISYTAQDK